jgi:DNA repair exonuclease SbcCD ATPase subunit
MSREKMLQAEIALKDEQLADLKKEIEWLRRQAEAAGTLAQAVDASESKIAELKQTIGKLAPAAKKTVQYAAELNEARRRLAVVKAERNDFAKNCSMTNAQTLALKNALAEAQSDARSFDTERKAATRRAKKAKTAAKTTARKNLIIAFAAAILCATTIGGIYAYVRAALAPPAELSSEAAAAFKQHAPEYRRIVKLAVQNERENLKAERESLAAERSRYQELGENTLREKIVFYAWLVLIFGGGFVAGAIAIFVAFIFRMR